MPGYLSRVLRLEVHPTRTVILSFAVVILFGTALLTTSAAAAKGGRLSLVDALFTATSATCVTGLTVRNPATDLTRFGQVVILGLVQVGGLGLMTFSVVFLTLVGKRITWRERSVIQDTFTYGPTRDLLSLLRSIFVFTFWIEVAGAIAFFACWFGRYPLPLAIYHSVFHAISAFCNAGFSTFEDNLVGFSREPAPLLVCAALIILGGIGFLTLWEVWRRARKLRHRSPPLSLHTRTVLFATAAILVTGTALFWLLEEWAVLAWHAPGTGAAFDGLPFTTRISLSFYHVVSARTAGFNAMDLAAVRAVTLVVLIAVMFVGASSGSTGGGIKTGTAAVLGASLRAAMTGRERVELFHRTIPAQTVVRAFVVFLSAVILLVVANLTLAVTEQGLEGTFNRPGGLSLALVFESVSAFGTVGLSTGVTPSLSPWGKLVLVGLMFVGRVGPLTLALAVQRDRRPHGDFQYVEENLMIG